MTKGQGRNESCERKHQLNLPQKTESGGREVQHECQLVPWIHKYLITREHFGWRMMFQLCYQRKSKGGEEILKRTGS